MKKWRVLGISAALGAVLAMSGCGNQQASNSSNAAKQDTPAKNELVIGFAHCCERGQISTMDAVEDIIKAEIDKAGMKMLFETAEETKHLVQGEDGKPLKDENGKEKEMDDYYTVQPAQMKKMIDAGAKAIILITVQGKDEEKMQTEMLEYAKEKGVSVIAVRRPLKKSIHSRFDNAYSVGSSPEAVPALQAKMIVEQWKKHPEWDKNGDGKIQFGLLRGKEGSSNDNLRKNVPSKINASDLETQKIAEGIANWNRDEGSTVVNGWIKSGDIDKMEIIISGSDDMALGALDALRAAKKPVPPIFGFNAVKEAQEAIKSGEFGGSLLRDFGGHGKMAVKVAQNLASGKSPIDGIDAELEGGTTINLPYDIVTQDNVDQYLGK